MVIIIKKHKMRIPLDPAIPFLGTVTYRNTCLRCAHKDVHHNLVCNIKKKKGRNKYPSVWEWLSFKYSLSM